MTPLEAIELGAIIALFIGIIGWGVKTLTLQTRIERLENEERVQARQIFTVRENEERTINDDGALTLIPEKKEGNMNESFDHAQQRHDANTEPPEPRLCEPGEHQIDMGSIEVEDTGRDLYLNVRCELCGATTEFVLSEEGWEL